MWSRRDIPPAGWSEHQALYIFKRKKISVAMDSIIVTQMKVMSIESTLKLNNSTDTKLYFSK
jgi:hypothetical protein